jgi:hypothetical protein
MFLNMLSLRYSFKKERSWTNFWVCLSQGCGTHVQKVKMADREACSVFFFSKSFSLKAACGDVPAFR